MAIITVGPVIGAVTATTARVLVELDRDGEYTLEARAESGHRVAVRRRATGGLPAAFGFTELLPGTRYALHLSEAELPLSAGFRTLPDPPRRLRIGAVSCNDVRQAAARDLWSQLWADEVACGSLDLLLHLGDQVYVDGVDGGPFLVRARRSLSRVRGELDRRILLAQTREMYRRKYRETWQHAPTRQVLAHVPNLMVWDDHELYDDWGTRRAERRPDTPERLVGQVARGVYRAYQRQLWDDLEPDPQDVAPNVSGHEHHFHAWGRIGIAFLDLRTARSFEYVRGAPYTGRQLDELEGALRGGVLAGVRALVVVTPVPVALCGGRLTDQLARQPLDGFDDSRDQWAYKPHRHEQRRLLDLLRSWQAAGPRKALILSGDAHFGALTRITHSDGSILEQMISSPIATAPPSDPVFQLIKHAMHNDDPVLAGGYHFAHRDLVNRRNYGVVDIEVPDDGPPRMSAWLVT